MVVDSGRSVEQLHRWPLALFMLLVAGVLLAGCTSIEEDDAVVLSHDTTPRLAVTSITSFVWLNPSNPVTNDTDYASTSTAGSLLSLVDFQPWNFTAGPSSVTLVVEQLQVSSVNDKLTLSALEASCGGSGLSTADLRTTGNRSPVSLDIACSNGWTAARLNNLTATVRSLSVQQTDGEWRVFHAWLEVTFTNNIPVAEAGPDQAVNESVSVALNGAGSSDPDGSRDPLTYSWIQTAGIPVTLNSSSVATPSFTAPALSTNAPTTLTFQLTATDPNLDSDTDIVNVTVTNINEAPTANAGPDQSVLEAAPVTLSGSASSDPDADTLTFSWSQTSGPAVTLSGATSVSPTFTAPTLPTSASATLVFALTVGDGVTSSAADTVSVTVNNVNQAPTSNAGSNLTVLEGATVTLSGSASSDPDADVLTYAWSQTSGPAVTLTSATAASPGFAAPTLPTNAPVTLVFSLTVADGSTTSTADAVSVTVNNINEAPTANAGSDQTVLEEAGVTLSGSASSDPDADVLSYAWTQTSGPAVSLSGATTAAPTFTAPTLPTNAPATLVFSLTVGDGVTSSAADTLSVTVNNLNQAPTADAGSDQTVLEGAAVTLTGSGSSDPDADVLGYAWSQTSGPVVTLSSATAASPAFTAPTVPTNAPVTLVFELLVSDGSVSSVADAVEVTVENINAAPVANAGADQTVLEGASAVLNASLSADPDSDTLLFAWFQVSGSAVILSDASSSMPSFTAPTLLTNVPVTLTFELTASDGSLASNDTLQVTVNNVNVAPVAAAGPDQAVDEASSVALNGSASSDADSDALTYAWTQTSGPSVALTGGTTSAPSFTSPTLATNAPVTLGFGLTVDDGMTASTADLVEVLVNNVNAAPAANAGSDATLGEGQTLSLDASGSSDPDSDALTYAWTQTSGPAATLDDAGAAAPNLTAPTLANNTPAVLVFSLVVGDGVLSSAPDTVEVTVDNVNQPPVALAGANITASSNVSVVLNGTGSSDPDGDALTYAWSQTSGATATLNSSTAASPTFNASTGPATLVFSLVVTDALGEPSAASLATVTVLAPPEPEPTPSPSPTPAPSGGGSPAPVLPPPATVVNATPVLRPVMADGTLSTAPYRCDLAIVPDAAAMRLDVQFPAACGVALLNMSLDAGPSVPLILSAVPLENLPGGLASPALAGATYQILDVRLLGDPLDAPRLSSVTLRFEVDRDWEEANCPETNCRLVLFHGSGSAWEIIEATAVSTGPATTVYEARADSVSLFVFGGAAGAEGEPSADRPVPGPPFAWVAAVAALALIGIRALRRRSA